MGPFHDELNLYGTDRNFVHEAGWDEDGIYEATALISYFNFSGRM